MDHATAIRACLDVPRASPQIARVKIITSESSLKFPVQIGSSGRRAFG